ncbi:MAG TPA: OprO/OprP family phosphate-selective porin [Allosphingosinicella sp.]
MFKTVTTCLLATAALLAANPAHAQDEETERFEGAPRIGSTDGWSLKPRGRFQYDVGHISGPTGLNADLGAVNELRRARIGVEGTAPGGFGYTFEIDFAEGIADITDAIVTYKAADGLTLTAGQHNNFQSLEELTSSRFSTFVERSAFTDAFNFERRLGGSATYARGPITAQAGVFVDNLRDLDDGDDTFSVDGRLVYAPKVGDTQLHFGGSAHWRDNGDLVDRGTTTRYRQRPLIHATSVRFLATPALPVERETHYGLEAAVMHGPFHAAAEAHWLNADTRTGAEPTLFGGYVELGWFITGESRGYRGARFDRTKVRRGGAIEEGGFGALQVALRYDHLDLNSNGITGGRQAGWQAALTWIPTDHIRFLANYARLDYRDARLPAASGDRDYPVDVVALRAQFDF